MQFMVRTVKCPPEDKQLAYSKHVEDVIKIKLKKVHLVGFVIQFIMIQVNIISDLVKFIFHKAAFTNSVL
jgi:hypothetical protein